MKRYNHKKHHFWWMFSYDLRWGIVGQWKKWILVVLFCMISCLFLNMQARGISRTSGNLVTGSMLDYFIHFVHGMERFEPSAQKAFQIPVVYMGIMIGISYMIGGYASKDLGTSGIQTMTRSKSRVSWMLSKILWNISVVMVVFGFMILFSMIFGEKNLSISDLLCQRVMHFHGITEGMGAASLSETELIGRALLMALLTSMAFALLQMTIELIATPVIGFLWNLCLIFLSAYITSPFLLGNYWMLQRSNIFLENGMNMGGGIIASLGVMFISIVTDLWIIRKKDIGMESK